jgi:hypothetical protein
MVSTVWETFTPVAVLPNTQYLFSFYLTNANTTNVAQIQPFANGVALGSAVSAKGQFSDGIPGDQWQQFSFSWFSGGATTVDLSLKNLQGTSIGNDFGLDTIALDPVAVP